MESLDVHAARLRVEHLDNLQLVREGKLVTEFWMAYEAKNAVTKRQVLTYKEPPPREEVQTGTPVEYKYSYIHCRAVTADSFTKDLALVICGSMMFAVQTTTNWIRSFELYDEYRHASSPSFAWLVKWYWTYIATLQCLWIFVSCTDAQHDVRVNSDNLNNDKCRQLATLAKEETDPLHQQRMLLQAKELCCSARVQRFLAASVLKIQDIPAHIRNAPTFFHYKKVNQPWAQLKWREVRLWIHGYPQEKLFHTEAFSNGPWNSKIKLLMSGLSLVIQMITLMDPPTTTSSTTSANSTTSSATSLAAPSSPKAAAFVVIVCSIGVFAMNFHVLVNIQEKFEKATEQTRAAREVMPRRSQEALAEHEQIQLDVSISR